MDTGDEPQYDNVMSSLANNLSADEVIALLELAPHPEGGHFRETFRDAVSVNGARSASTAIYFLLREGEVSRWHRVDAAEAWHWYAGAPLAARHRRWGRASHHHPGSRSRCRTTAAGRRTCARLAAGAQPGSWTLVGCTVAPGFEFAAFELAPPEFEP